MIKFSKKWEKDFYSLLDGIDQTPEALKMKEYIQHGKVSTYEHCMRVAKQAYYLNEKFRVRCNKRHLVRAAFLHDYFLYDWHHHKGRLHGFYHPGVAARNAVRDFRITKTEEHIIRCHMWPLTITSVPSCREAWIVTLADKIVSARETLMERKVQKAYADR